MKTVVFKRDSTEGGRRLHRKGELLQLPDGEAERLAGEGVVEIRYAHEPTETKERQPSEEDDSEDGAEPA